MANCELVSRMHTFYLEKDKWGKETWLEGSEAHHAASVLRVAIGEKVKILDGQGAQGIYRVTALKQKKVFLAFEESELVPQPNARAVIALAFSKAVRRGFFFEKAAELGAEAVWVWQGDHSQGKLASSLADVLQKQMIAGIKQSGNPWLPSVQVLPGGIDELVAKASNADFRILPWEQENAVNMLSPQHMGQPGVTIYVIGPEGGFSERELETLVQNDFLKVSLGPRIFRCETAATLCLGLHWWASHCNAGNDKD